MKPDLSIIIVNWKVRKLLEKCLDSILANQENYHLEIFVVDNNSLDGTPEMVMIQYPEIKMITLINNQGFAKANNLAIKQAKSAYILLLNPDTEIMSGFFTTTINYLDQHQEVGILAPKILNPDKSIQFSVRRLPNLTSQILTLLKLQNILVGQKNLENYISKRYLNLVLKLKKRFGCSKTLSSYLAQDFDYQKEQDVEQVMGAAMIIRRSVFDKIGLLDPRFFVWFEEVDFCKRTLEAGFKIKYLPQTSIIHYEGSSFSKAKILRKQIIFNNSLLYYFWKHKPIWQWFIILLMLPINFVLTLLYVLFIKKKQG